MFVVIERHELRGNLRIWTGFKTTLEAGQFAEKLGEENPDDLIHYDMLPTIQRDFKVVHIQYVHLASNEWSQNQIGGKPIMEVIAKEILDKNKHRITEEETIAVHVCEHAGWSLVYTLDSKGELMIVGSANDAAHWAGEKKEWRWRAHYADWRQISSSIRREPQ